MGCSCCKCRRREVTKDDKKDKKPSELERHLQSVFAPLGPSEISSYFALPPHVFIVGPQSVGKTSLFVRLAYPELPEDDAIAIISETTTYHVEAISLYDRRCFLWDLAGDPVLMGPNIDSLRCSFVRGIIWMASMLDVKKESIAESRRWIDLILADKNISSSGFFVLMFNTYDLFADEEAPYELTQQGKQVLQFLLRTYNVNALSNLHQPRFMWTVCNVKAGWNDPRIQQAAQWMHYYVNNC